MSATPRTMRTVTVPTAPRLRRVVGVGSRPLGPVTLFLVATAILGVTSLTYVWQAGQRTAAGMNIQALDSQLQNAMNTQRYLVTQIERLTSTDAVLQAASSKYHMRMPADPSTVETIVVPGPVVTVPKIVPAPAPAHAARTNVRVATTDAAVTSWWQDAWIVLYRLLR